MLKKRRASAGKFSPIVIIYTTSQYKTARSNKRNFLVIKKEA